MRLMLWGAAVLILAFTVRAETTTTVVADAGPDQTIAAGADGTATATLDGSKSTDSSGSTLTLDWAGPFTEGGGHVSGVNPTVTLPLGASDITLTVTNAAGETATDTVTITVADQTPPTISSLRPDPKLLWPPNHKMVEVTVTAVTADDSGTAPTCKIVNVTSNEPDNGKGDGNTINDIQITGDMTVDLRAERAGPGSGRIYTITVECTDAAGNKTTQDAVVKVPHDARQMKNEMNDDDGTDATDGSDGGSSTQSGKPAKGHGHKGKGKGKGKGGSGKGKGNGKDSSQSAEQF